MEERESQLPSILRQKTSNSKTAMRMKNRAFQIIAILLVLSVGNYFLFTHEFNNKTVDSISSFVMGMLTALLLVRLFRIWAFK